MLQDWDRIVMLIVGAGIALYHAYGGWRSWKQRRRKEAAGSLILAVVVAGMPLVLMTYEH